MKTLETQTMETETLQSPEPSPADIMTQNGASPLLDLDSVPTVPVPVDPQTVLDPENLIYSVIYDYDVSPETSVRKYEPPARYAKRNGLRVWDLTESWTQGPDEPYGGGLPGFKHRKLVALLTYDQLVALAESVPLYASDVRTLGSLGAPGLGLGLAPAISFELEPDQYTRWGQWTGDAYGSAYVTPIPARFGADGDLEPTVPVPMTESTWETIRSGVIDRFGYDRTGF